MRVYDCRQTLQARRTNPLSTWHVGGSGVVSPDPNHAANRIWRGYADVAVAYDGPRFTLADPVFTMGSCFARELEHALMVKGGRVVNVDRRTLGPEFGSPEISPPGFFYRFTPWAMWQEFKRCFDEMPGWSEDALIMRGGTAGGVVDLHYGKGVGLPASLEDTLARRQVARDLVRRVARARIVVLTLGLIEAWRHRPTGLYVNHPRVKLLANHAEDFELRVMECEDVVACLEDLHDLLRRRHVDGDFEFVVTVSPVPMDSTFLDIDVTVANTESKAVLRAAAATFAARHPRVRYFPSYELVTLSSPEVAWRPDRRHVNREMVDWIIERFLQAYYKIPAAQSL